MFTLPIDRPPSAAAVPPAPEAFPEVFPKVFPSVSPEAAAAPLDPTDLEVRVAAAMAAAVQAARTEGKSLADLQADVLTDHNLLDAAMRKQLSEILSEAWQQL